MNTPTPDIRSVLLRLVGGGPLSEAQAEQVFELVLSGAVDESQIASLLSLLAARGPSIDELVAGARVMRRHLTPVPFEATPAGPGRTAPVVIDTCGTGGAPKAFNVSTGAALVTAAAAPGRVAVAKHGGRSRTGRGSAEVLQRLGVNVDAAPTTQARCLAELGVCFSFAVNHHPAMKHAAAVRRSLGFPTIFNLLGPLANPARAPRQLIGTYSPEAAGRLAEALARLGTERSLVVTSRDGMDELTTTDVNLLWWVRGAQVSAETLDASTLGLARATIDELRTADLDGAVALLRSVLEGQAGPARDVVVLNAGAALAVAGAAPDFATGLTMAREAIDAGRAIEILRGLARLSNEPAAP